MSVLLVGSRSPRAVASTSMDYASPADGDHFTIPAEVARLVHEYVDGDSESSYGTLSPVAPPTPMHGNDHPGHDHTGGMMGHPQKHTVWQHSWGYPDDANTEFNEAPLTTDAQPSRIVDSLLPSIWCPPGYVYKVGCLVTFKVRFVSAYSHLNFRIVANGVAIEHAYTSAASTGTKSITVTKLLPLLGGFNTVHLKIEADTWSGAGACHLLHMGIHQIHDTPLPTLTP